MSGACSAAARTPQPKMPRTPLQNLKTNASSPSKSDLLSLGASAAACGLAGAGGSAGETIVSSVSSVASRAWPSPSSSSGSSSSSAVRSVACEVEHQSAIAIDEGACWPTSSSGASVSEAALSGPSRTSDGCAAVGEDEGQSGTRAFGEQRRRTNLSVGADDLAQLGDLKRLEDGAALLGQVKKHALARLEQGDVVHAR